MPLLEGIVGIGLSFAHPCMDNQLQPICNYRIRSARMVLERARARRACHLHQTRLPLLRHLSNRDEIIGYVELKKILRNRAGCFFNLKKDRKNAMITLDNLGL